MAEINEQIKTIGNIKNIRYCMQCKQYCTPVKKKKSAGSIILIILLSIFSFGLGLLLVFLLSGRKNRCPFCKQKQYLRRISQSEWEKYIQSVSVGRPAARMLTQEQKNLICPKCGSENYERDMFCRSCGSKLAKEIGRSEPTPHFEIDQEQKGLICSRCGSEMDEEDKFCRSCGRKILRETMEGEWGPHYKVRTTRAKTTIRKTRKPQFKKRQPQFEPYLNKLVLGSLYLGGFVLLLTLLLPTAYIDRDAIIDYLIWGWFMVYRVRDDQISPYYRRGYFSYGIFMAIIILMVSIFIMVETYRVNKGFINIDRCRTHCLRANLFCLAFQIFYLLYFLVLGFFIPLPHTRSFIPTRWLFYRRIMFIPYGLLISFIGNTLIIYGIKMSKKSEGIEQ